MPAIWEFFIEAESPSAATKRDVHWLLSTWLDVTPEGERPAERALPHSALPQPKAWALKGILPHSSGIRVQVGLLEDVDQIGRSSLAEALAKGVRESLDSDAQGRLGRAGQFRTRSYRLRDAAAELHLTSAVRWSELLLVEPAGRWRFDFLTTTSFRSGQHYVPFPLPALIFDGLSARWRAWSDTPLPLPASGASCRVATVDADIHRSVENGVLGFTGRVEQEIVESPGAGGTEGTHHPESVTPLASLAEFCGIGVATAFGLGSVRYAPSRRHRR